MIIAVVGATGTGKSDLSLDVADALTGHGLGAEIVNADAMQLYRGMDIGTAKLPVEERRGYSHHMLDVLDVTQEAAVADYQAEARAAIAQIIDRGNVPILVGGSGLYVSGVLYDFEFPAHDEQVRAQLEKELEELGAATLFQRLVDAAPEAAARIDQKNSRRIVRALEVLEVTGDTASLGTLPPEPKYWQDVLMFGLREDREILVERLDRRVENMWSKGLVEEVEGLIPRGLEEGVTARRAIGYAQALGQVHGDLSQDEAIEQTQALTRRYARRQVSWFKRYPDVTWHQASQSGLGREIANAYFERMNP